MSVVSMKQLLEAGVHFGHQTRRWNPKMAEYIFTERNGIYIIDLQKTVKKLEEAYILRSRRCCRTAAASCSSAPRSRLQDAIKEEADRVRHVLCQRQMAGRHAHQLQDHAQHRIDRLAQLEKMQEDGTFDMLPKKEVIKLHLRDREAREVPRRHQGNEEAPRRTVHRRPPQGAESQLPRRSKLRYPDRRYR